MADPAIEEPGGCLQVPASGFPIDMGHAAHVVHLRSSHRAETSERALMQKLLPVDFANRCGYTIGKYLSKKSCKVNSESGSCKLEDSA